MKGFMRKLIPLLILSLAAAGRSFAEPNPERDAYLAQ